MACGDVGSNIELFVVGQHQLSCRPCFKLYSSRTNGGSDRPLAILSAPLSTGNWRISSKLLQVIRSPGARSLSLSPIMQIYTALKSSRFSSRSRRQLISRSFAFSPSRKRSHISCSLIIFHPPSNSNRSDRSDYGLRGVGAAPLALTTWRNCQSSWAAA